MWRRRTAPGATAIAQLMLAARRLVVLWAMPAVGLVLVLTNEYHHLIWTSIARSTQYSVVLVYGHGPDFWILVGYTYVLLAAGAVVMALAVARLPAPFK